MPKDSLSQNTIDLGRAGEANARRVVLEIPCCWEGATSENVMFLFQRPGTTAAIPYDVIIDNYTAFVTVDASMTKSGEGRAQLLQLKDEYDINNIIETLENGGEIEDSVIVNSKIYKTICGKSLNEETPVAEPQSTWLTNIIQAGNRSQIIINLWEQGLLQKKLVAGSERVHITRGINQDIIDVDVSGGDTFVAGQGIEITEIEEGKEISTTQDIDQMAEDIEGKVDKETGKGLSTNDYTDADKEAVENIDTNISQQIGNHNQSNQAHSDLRSGIADINSKIMADTTSTNQLANKDFVNSSISSQTATFKGNYDVVEDLGLEHGATQAQIAAALKTTITDATNNDYCMVQDDIPGEKNDNGTLILERFKYNAEDEEWLFEYSVNATIFTAQQLAAINSGIDATKVAQIATNTDAISGKLDKDTSTTTYPKAYVKLANGTNDKMSYTADNYANSLVLRDANGRSNIAAPTQDTHIANKKFVEEAVTQGLGGKVDKVTSTSTATYRPYVVMPDGSTSVVNATASPSNQLIAMYDRYSNLHTHTTPFEANSCTSKQYVDNLVGITKTTLDATATANTNYYLGEQSAVSLVLPSNISTGQFINVVFYSGTTAATLSITGADVLGEEPTIEANQRVELSLLFDGEYWSLLSNVMAVE